MATITGNNGTAGHNGTATVSPTAGGDGQDESFTLNGNITSIFDPVIVTGGIGGKGGNGAAGHPGAPGGRGGNANISLGGNIIMPLAGSFNMTGTATGGKGGAGGTGTPGGDGGPGGSASVLFNGNIIQASNNLSTITVEAVANAGAGGAAAAGGTKGNAGNADAELNGNIVQYGGSSAANATVAAIANGATGDSNAFEGDPTWGSKTATLNGNIVQGNLNNVTMQADAKFSNSTATITGNIIQTNANNTGLVTLEATGEHIDIEKNKVTLGKQNFAFTLNELGPDYDTTVKGNTFTGSGTNTFIFTDNATPGPSPDVISIDLTAKKFIFNGDNNTISKFANITVNGNAGMILTGDAGNNIITGGNGNDTIIATAGTDTYDGGGGINTLDYSENAMGPGGVTVNLSLTTAQAVGGGFGPDTILHIQNLIGTDFNDVLTGSSANNVIDALGGDDTVFATAGADTYDGGAGTDTLDYSLAPGVGAVGVTVDLSLTTAQAVGGGFGPDTISNFENLNGSAKNDKLTGTSGNNVIQAGAGNDTIIATDGTDTYDGGAGTDTLDFSNSPVGVTVNLTAGTATGWGTDTILGIEKVIGSSHNDVITGLATNDTIQAGAGNDTINATKGTDVYDGGTGIDMLSYAGATVGVKVDLSLTGPQTVAAGYVDTITGIEKVTGTSMNDFLAGSGLGGNTLNGGAGNDILYSRGGGTNSVAGAGGTDVAYYDGLETDYSTVTPTHVVGGPDGANDTLSAVERLKFLAPSHVADVNDNGTGDFILQSTVGPAAIYGAGPAIPVPLTASQKIIGTGQFNPDVDRNAGLLIQDSTSHQISVIADPTVSTALVPVFNPGANWNAVTAGDFNGDASSDILIQNSVTGQAKILFLKENSTDAVGTVNGAAVIITPPNGTGWKAIAAGDFNGDGKSDIVWQQGGAGGPVEVTLMNGSTITNPTTTPLPTLAGWTAVATGDFNSDGKSDIVFSTGPAGSPAGIWTMNGDSINTFSTVAAPTVGVSGPGAFTLKGAEDVNGDGVSDLLWQNTVNGDIDATLMTNPGTYTQAPLFSSGSPAVHLLASTGGG